MKKPIGFTRMGAGYGRVYHSLESAQRAWNRLQDQGYGTVTLVADGGSVYRVFVSDDDIDNSLRRNPVNDDEDEEESKSAIEQIAEEVGADPDDSDFLFGLYVYGMNYHGGQWSRLYEAMSSTGASLRDSHIKAIENGRYDKNGEWEVARMWYRALKRAKVK